MPKVKSLVFLGFVSLVAAFAVEACVSDEPASSESSDGGAGDATQSDGNAAVDSGATDGSTAACSPTGAFQDPVEIPSLHVAGAAENWVTFSTDGLSALITRTNPGEVSSNLYLADRSSTTDDFPSGVELGPEINSTGLDGGISGGGRGTFADAKKTIFFEARTPGPDNVDIYMATRDSTASVAFQPRATVPQFSGTGDHGQPYLVNDSLYSFYNPGGTFQIQQTHRGVSGFDTPQQLTNLDNHVAPVVTLDEKTIFLGNAGHVFEAHRSDPSGPFGVPTEIASTVSTGHETPSDVSADGCTLYFTRSPADAGPERRVYMSTRSK